jgi:hypothetical protein
MIMGLMDCSESDINGLMTWELLYCIQYTEIQHLLMQQKKKHGQTTADQAILAIRSFCFDFV